MKVSQTFQKIPNSKKFNNVIIQKSWFILFLIPFLIKIKELEATALLGQLKSKSIIKMALTIIIQLRAKQTAPLVNKQYENEVTLR